MELRCDTRIHGIVNDGLMEVKCRAGACGASAGVTVMHYFDLSTGELVKTEKYKDPKVLFHKEEPKCR